MPPTEPNAYSYTDVPFHYTIFNHIKSGECVAHVWFGINRTAQNTRTIAFLCSHQSGRLRRLVAALTLHDLLDLHFECVHLARAALVHALALQTVDAEHAVPDPGDVIILSAARRRSRSMWGQGVSSTEETQRWDYRDNCHQH